MFTPQRLLKNVKRAPINRLGILVVVLRTVDRRQVVETRGQATVLGPEWAGPARDVPPRPRDVPFGLAGAAFTAVLVSTVLPWTRFGEASGLFGAWGIWPFQWSLLAAGAATMGLILWLGLRVGDRTGGRVGAFVLLVLAGAAMGGAILHMYNPPPFTQAWLGPWVGLGSAAVATGTCAWLVLRAALRSGRATA